MKPNKKFWIKKNVMITGHTGFKGGWLTVLLDHLGAKVSGYSLNPHGVNNFFKSTKIKKIFRHDFRKNIKDLNELKRNLKKAKPEIIFHLAAQSSVIESFKNPNNTVLSNVLGTSNVLEAAKNIKSLKCIVIITTDKVYQNYKFKKYFNEDSMLGGDDIYSGSKACCEILINSYKKSFFSKKKCKIASVRAGNCFGGGDWTKDRIAKDSLESFYNNKTLVLRNPNATRPWQHVLEPITGYLMLAEKLCSNAGDFFSGPWNFGPSSRQNMTVQQFARIIKKELNSSSKILVKKNDKRFQNKKFKVFESKYLEIDSKKAFKKLKWKPKLTIKEAIILTVEWYTSFRKRKNLLNLTKKQIENYLKK